MEEGGKLVYRDRADNSAPTEIWRTRVVKNCEGHDTSKGSGYMVGAVLFERARGKP